MATDLIALTALLVMYFGFAALLGALMTRALTLAHGAILGIASFLYLLATVTLPMALTTKIIVLAVSLVLFALAAARTPRFLFQPEIGWLYAAFAMGLVLLWTVTQGWQVPLLSLGAAAALAAILAWRRGLRETRRLTSY